MTAGAVDGAPVEVRRATARKGKTGKKPRVHPGRNLHRGLTRKGDPVRVEELPDLDLLGRMIGPQAAAAVLTKCGGSVRHLDRLGTMQEMMTLPGVSEGRAVQLVVLWELVARIAGEED